MSTVSNNVSAPRLSAPALANSTPVNTTLAPSTGRAATLVSQTPVDSFEAAPRTSASGNLNLSGTITNPAINGSGSFGYANGTTNVNADVTGQVNRSGVQGEVRANGSTSQQLGNTQVDVSGALQGSTQSGVSGTVNGNLQHSSTVQNGGTTTSLDVRANGSASLQTGGASSLGGNISVGLDRTGPNGSLSIDLSGRGGTGSGTAVNGSLDWRNTNVQTRPNGSTVTTGAGVNANGSVVNGAGSLEVNGNYGRVVTNGNGQVTSQTQVQGGISATTGGPVTGQITGSHSSGATQASGSVVLGPNGRPEINASIEQQIDPNTQVRGQIDLDKISVDLNRGLGQNGNVQVGIDSNGNVSGQIQYNREW